MRWGRWWAVQRNGGFSLGLHIEFQKHNTNSGIPYGPYVDIHLAQWVLSFGRNPIYAGELHLKASYSRGGISGYSN